MQRLKGQTDNANVRAEQLQIENEELAAELERSSRFADDLIPGLEEGRLTGTDVVVVADEGTDPALLDRASGALRTAGARVVTVLSVTPRMISADPAVRRQLAHILGVPAATPGGTMSKDAAAQLAQRLSAGVTVEPGATEEPRDLLLSLLDGGFLESDPTMKSSDLVSVGGDGQAFVTLAGGPTPSTIPPEDFMLPLVQDLARQGMPVAAGEPSSGPSEFVTQLRTDGIADGEAIVTVDNADESVGGLALVLGLRDLLLSDQGGNFGFKQGADEIYPAST